MENNRLNFLLNGLVRENRERQTEQAAAATGADNEYQEMINRANAEDEAVEMLSQLRAMPGRDY